MLPKDEKWTKFSKALAEFGSSVKDVIEIGEFFMGIIIT